MCEEGVDNSRIAPLNREDVFLVEAMVESIRVPRCSGILPKVHFLVKALRMLGRVDLYSLAIIHRQAETYPRHLVAAQDHFHPRRGGGFTAARVHDAPDSRLET